MASNSSFRDKALLIGLVLECAAMADIFLVRRGQRPVGGSLIVLGAMLLTTYFILRAFAQANYLSASIVPMLLSVIGGVLCAAIALIQLVFTVLAAGSPTTRRFFLGAVMAAIVALILLDLLADSLLQSRSRSTR